MALFSTIIRDFETFAGVHDYVEQFQYGNNNSLRNALNVRGDTQYPMLFVQAGSASDSSTKVETQILRIWCFTCPNDGNVNNTMDLSATREVLYDLESYLQYTSNYMSVTTTPKLTLANDPDFNETFVGWYADFSIQSKRGRNINLIP